MTAKTGADARHPGELHRRTAALTRFVNGMAHDYNNLLTAIASNAHLLDAGLPADSPLRAPLGRLEYAAREAAALTHRIQAYAPSNTAAFEPLSLSVLVDRLVRKLAPTVQPPVRIEVALEPDLPMIPLAAPLLEDALHNLLTNAMEALAGRAGAVTVRTAFAHGREVDPHTCLLVEHLRPAPYSALEVSNDGPPLSAEFRDHMFDPYFSTRIRADGLGLCGVLGMARTHRAVIDVPHQAEGCTIRILFPG